MSNFYSLTIIAPATEVTAINAALEAFGYGPNNISAPIRGGDIVATDEEGNLLETPSGYSCHWWADEATLSNIASIRNTTLKNCHIHARKQGEVATIPEIDIEQTPEEPEPLGTFNATLGDNIVVSHKEFNPGQWGWRAEMVVASGAFDPGVRAIAIYSDTDHTQYQYTTGAFVWDAGISRWVTEWNEGNGSKTDIHFAVLFASVQESRGTLSAAEDDAVAYMRFGIPKEAPVGDTWTDSGETVVALVGAGVIRVTDTAPFGATQPIRINGTEATVSSIFTAGVNGIIVISPHIPVSGGEVIEILQ